MARSGRKPETKPPSFERVDACIRNLQDRHDYWHKITRTPATREAAMAGIVGDLQAGHLPISVLDMRCLAIFAFSGVSIKKGTPKEARLAYRAVSLLLLTLHDGSPGPLLDEAFPALSKAIQADDAPPATLIAAIDCLATASFTGACHVEEAMKAIWHVMVKPPVRSRSTKLKTREAPETSLEVLAAAVSAWTFLLATTTTTQQQQKKADRGTSSWSTSIASLMEMLDADDRRVRIAAGEALAVCVELNLLTNKDMDVLVAKVSELADELASKGANNTLLREQKELFGRIAAFLDHDEPPEASVRTSSERQGVMKVSTWVRLAQLNFLSKLLGNGFLKHAQDNPRLNEAFRSGRVEGKPLSIQDDESGMTIDDFFPWHLYRDRDCPWISDNIFSREGPQGLLQLGWH
ncbi:unnamed protein product [Urochloa decumbens]|uniref:Interferon-related developmental regulator N-terminal domain-containing protein n=1 Tax=Urochloa decumbens TaxID=240449 RepID=A0ABC8YD19_9POAL